MFFAGDAYILGNDIEKGIKNLTLKYGKMCGFWLGPQRAVIVADFEILQEMLNRNETSGRQIFAPAVASKFLFLFSPFNERMYTMAKQI